MQKFATKQYTTSLFVIGLTATLLCGIGLGVYAGIYNQHQDGQVDTLRRTTDLVRGQVDLMLMQSVAVNSTVIETGVCDLVTDSTTFKVPYQFSSYQIGPLTRYYATFLPTGGPVAASATFPITPSANCPNSGLGPIYAGYFAIRKCTTDPTGATLKFAQINVGANTGGYFLIDAAEVNKIVLNGDPAIERFLSNDAVQYARCGPNYFVGIATSLPTLNTYGLGLFTYLYGGAPYTSLEIVEPIMILLNQF